jgi:hypothetical protein
MNSTAVRAGGSRDRTQSARTVSAKREYSPTWPETFTDGRPAIADLGVQRRSRTREKTAFPAPFFLFPVSLEERGTAWLGRKDSNLYMAILKSDALACPRGAAEPHFVRIHKPLEKLKFREPYRIGGVQSSGEK